jgi:O-antigen/teichoic acid export membrane protein
MWINTLWKLCALAGSKLMIFAFTLVMARWLSLPDFGYLSFALAYAQIAFVLVDAGVSTALWREASTAGDQGLRVYLSAHRLRPYTIFAGLGLALAGLGWFDLPPNAQFLVVIIGLGTGIDAVTNLDQAILRSRERLGGEAAVMLVGRAVFVILALGMIATGTGLIGIGVAYMAGHLCALILSRRLVSFSGTGRVEPEFAPTNLLRLALPLAAVNFFTVVYFRIDTVMLQGIAGPAPAGLYNAAYRLMEAAMMVPAALLTALFPRLSRQAEALEGGLSPEPLARLLVHLATAGTAFGLAFAPEVLALFFGPTFVPAANTLRILLFALWIIYTNYLLTNLLIVYRRQAAFARMAGLCALVNVALNVALIPLWSMAGAAVATTITEGVLLLLAWRDLRAHQAPLRLQNLTFSLHYGAVFLGLLLAVKTISVSWAAAAGVLVLIAWTGGAAWGFQRRALR